MSDNGMSIPGLGPGNSFEDIFNAPMPTGGGGGQELLGGFSAVDPAQMGGPGGVPYRPGQAPEVYYKGEVDPGTPGIGSLDILRGMVTEDRVRLQEQLRALGLARQPRYGYLDDDTISGFEEVLAIANRQGERWTVTLGNLATTGGIEEEQGFQPEPYLAPDYATVAQRVKATFREQLGRDPDDYELQQLASELSGFDALAHEREQEYAELAANPAAQPGEMSGVDPLARFNQRFEELFAGELDTIEGQEAARLQQGAVQSGVDLVSRAARGGA